MGSAGQLSNGNLFLTCRAAVLGLHWGRCEQGLLCLSAGTPVSSVNITSLLYSRAHSFRHAKSDVFVFGQRSVALLFFTPRTLASTYGGWPGFLSHRQITNFIMLLVSGTEERMLTVPAPYIPFIFSFASGFL